MDPLLDNPVYHALISGDQHLALGSEQVKFFDPEVSPFVGFAGECKDGFEELHNILPAGRRVLYATRGFIQEPRGWQMRHEIKGSQFVFDTSHDIRQSQNEPVPLKSKHIDQMVELARLTKPGPFGKRTIEFGHYHGIFEDEKLIAMTGQRLHLQDLTEVSAVCTHPDHLGKGYAAALLQHQLRLILDKGQLPFLHVRADNERAIAIYERLGFVNTGTMNFYFLKRI